MQGWKRWLLSFVALVILVGSGYVVVVYFPYVFSKNVEGRVVGVKREDQYAESYVVAIRTTNGEIFTTHSDNAQWALVRVGQCAKAKYFPYPPWDFQKSGTYFGAKVLNLRDCTEKDGEWDPEMYCPGGSHSLESNSSSSNSWNKSNEGSESEAPAVLEENKSSEEKSESKGDKEDSVKEDESNFQRIREKYLDGPADT